MRDWREVAESYHEDTVVRENKQKISQSQLGDDPQWWIYIGLYIRKIYCPKTMSLTSGKMPIHHSIMRQDMPIPRPLLIVWQGYKQDL